MATEHDKSSVSIPTVHHEGSAFKDLVDQLSNAMETGNQFQKALSEARPKRIDYYPQKEGAFTQAQADYFSRMQKVDEVLDELAEIFRGIVHQRRD